MDHSEHRAAGSPESWVTTHVSRRRALFLGLTVVPSVALMGACQTAPPEANAAPAATPGEAAASSTPGHDVRDFGAVGDGVADDTDAVQSLIDAAAASGTAGVVSPGTFRCTRSLLLPANARLHLAAGARLVKDWAVTPGLANAFLRNVDFAVKSNGVDISGTGSIGATDHSRTGVILAVYGDDVRLRDFTIDTYAGGQAIMFSGDRGRIDNVRIVNSAPGFGTGGIRMIGGVEFVATGCHVESGDDCLQFVPIGDPGALLFNQSISRSSYIGCTGVSSMSRFMVALLEWTRGDGGLSASVSDCSFVSCSGRGANRGIVVKNTHSSGALERISFTDCTVDMAGSEDRQAQEIRVQTDPTSGGSIRDITFTRTNITNAVNPALRVGGPNISRLRFEGCVFPAPSGTATAGMVVDSARSVTFRDCAFPGATGKRQLTVGPQEVVTGLSLVNCQFDDIADRQWAVNLVTTRSPRVVGCTFREAAGGAGRALRIASTTSDALVRDCDFTGVTSPLKLQDQGVRTVLRDNVGLTA